MGPSEVTELERAKSMNKQINITIVLITLVTIGIVGTITSDSTFGLRIAAPIAISGDNIYIVWPTKRTGNDEVNFRASTDGGITFADKINLSNSTASESQDVEIAADGNNVIMTWWERNQTAEEPVARISSDNGATFGPLLRLATNGTIREATE